MVAIAAVLDRLVLAQPVGEGQLPGPVQQVAVAVGAPVVALAVLAQPDPDPGRGQLGQVEPPGRGARGDGRPGDVELGQLLDQPLTGGVGHSCQLVGVRQRDSALHAQGTGAFHDQLGGEHRQVSGFVQVDVHVDAVPLGQPEHDVEVPHRVAVELARSIPPMTVAPSFSASSR